LELGVRIALGDGYRCVGYVEREAFAAAALVARMEDAALDQAPVADCLESFDGRAWRGAVDLVTAGFPCPPVSVAGRRKGVDDDRWLWPEVWRICSDVGADVLFVENVAGLVADGRAFGSILGDLAEGGWSAEWLCVRASDVGASQKRRRVFVLAWRAGGGLGKLRQSSRRFGQLDGGDQGLAGPDGVVAGQSQRGVEEQRGRSTNGREELGDAESHQPGRLSERAEQTQSGPALAGGDVASAGDGQLSLAGRGSEGREGVGSTGAMLADPRRECGERSGVDRELGSAARREPTGETVDDSIPAFPPGPSDEDGWRDVLYRRGRFDLVPAINREEAALVASVCSVADGLASRLDRLRACGNGVVPLQAAAAFVELARRALT